MAARRRAVLRRAALRRRHVRCLDYGVPPAPRVPLYRVWRPFGDSNHRFTTEAAVVADMVAKGWVDEGVAMCVAGGG